MQSAPAADGDPIIHGAAAIARYLFADDSRAALRRIYHLAEQHGLPVFALGRSLVVRRSKLEDWLRQQEADSRRRQEKAG